MSEGKSKAEAQKICAIAYYKKHGKTPQEAEKMAEFKFNEALVAIWELIGFCDRYIEENRVWEGKDKDSIKNLLFALAKIGLSLQPFMPETSEKIIRRLGIDSKEDIWIFKVDKGEPLFPRI